MTEVEWLQSNDPHPMLKFVLKNNASYRKLRLFAVACCRRVWHLISEERVQELIEFAKRLRPRFTDRDWRNIQMSGRLDWLERDSPPNLWCCREAVELAERFADGLCSRQELSGPAGEAEGLYHVASFYDAGYVESWGNYQNNQMATGMAAFAAHDATADINTGDTNALHSSMAVAYHRGMKQSQEGSHYTAVTDAQENVAQARLVREVFGNPFRPIAIGPSWLSSTVTNLAESIYTDRAFDRLPILADALEDAGCTSHEILDHLRQPGEHRKGCWALDLVLGKE